MLLKDAYTIDQWVASTGIGRSKTYEEIAAGRLKVRKIGTRPLILREDGERFLDSLPVGGVDPLLSARAKERQAHRVGKAA